MSIASLPARVPARRIGRVALSALLLASTALLGGCGQNLNLDLSLFGMGSADGNESITTSAVTPANVQGVTPEQIKAELKKATEYWGTIYAKNPADADAAYNFSRNLKAMGEKQQALGVLQQAVNQNPGHRGLLSEYGRLALEFDQITLAEALLEKADDPKAPDWRVLSARGTAKAKQGLYSEAIPFYERALQLKADQPSVLSNLALAYTAEGRPDKAEPLLRRAAAARDADERVGQNLSLVLGLQGKYDEAERTAAQSMPAGEAASDVQAMRAMAKADAKPKTKAASATPKAANPLSGREPVF